MSEHHGHHHPRAIADVELKTQALEQLLIRKGLISAEEIEDLIHLFENQVGPMNGARVVARAWVDPEYKRRLLEDGSKGIQEMGIQDFWNTKLIVVENTPDVHNVIVCTLCSCYPWHVLGLPPSWYKSNAYRSRVVNEPREVLKDFGLELDALVEIRVWDSIADIRYLVLPERPAGTEHLSEEALAELITRDALVGVAKVTVDGL